jgi:hypothetical protein
MDHVVLVSIASYVSLRRREAFQSLNRCCLLFWRLLVLKATVSRSKRAPYAFYDQDTEERISESACAASSELYHDAGTDESPRSARRRLIMIQQQLADE